MDIKEKDLINILSIVDILHEKYIISLSILKDMLDKEERDVSFIDEEIEEIRKQKDFCEIHISFMLMIYNHMNSLYKVNKNIL